MSDEMGCHNLSFLNVEFQASFFTTRHMHNWVSFPPWPLHSFWSYYSNCPLLFPNSTVDTSWPEVLISGVVSFCLFILFMGFSRQEYWSDLPFPSPVDHILSELCTMTRLSWVALPYGMAHSFTELDKAVVHLIRLVSFLWMWFSVCVPSDGER